MNPHRDPRRQIINVEGNMGMNFNGGNGGSMAGTAGKGGNGTGRLAIDSVGGNGGNCVAVRSRRAGRLDHS